VAIAGTNVAVNGGTLNLTGGAAAQINSSAIVTLTNSGAFNFGSANQSLAGIVNNGGTVNYGTGTTVIGDPVWTAGTNTVPGNTTFSDGLGVSGGVNTITGASSGGAGFLTVQAGASSSAGGALTFSGTNSPNITVNSDNAAPGTLQVQGDIYDTDTTGTASITSGGSGSLAGKLDLDTTNSTPRGINVSSGGTLNIGISIIDSGSNAGVNVNSASLYTGTQGGTVVFSGTGSYTGPTTINGGALNVTGSIASSAVAVNSNSILEGSGSVGAITVAGGGTVTPGDPSSQSIGSKLSNSTHNILNGTSLTLAAGATLSYNLYSSAVSTGTSLNPAGGTEIDLGTGAFNVEGAVTLQFNNTGVGGVVGDPNVYNLVEFGTGNVTAADLSDFTITGLLTSSNEYGAASLSIVTSSNGEEYLQLDIVPEPSTWAMMLGGLSFLALALRSRRRAAKV